MAWELENTAVKKNWVIPRMGVCFWLRLGEGKGLKGLLDGELECLQRVLGVAGLLSPFAISDPLLL